MANKWAIQNGNWSDGSTWNDGVVPTAADDVQLGSYVVSITTDIIYFKTLKNDNNGYLDILNTSYNYGAQIYGDVICTGSTYIIWHQPNSWERSAILNGNVSIENQDCLYPIYLSLNGNMYINGDIYASSDDITKNRTIFGTVYNHTGRATVNGNIYSKNYRLYAIRQVNGNITISTQVQWGFSVILNGNLTIESYNNQNIIIDNFITGNITMSGSAPLSFRNLTIVGNITFTEDFTGNGLFTGNCWDIGAPSQTKLYGSLYNYSRCEYLLSDVVNTPAYNNQLIFSGDFHCGNIIGIGRWNSPYIPFRKIIALDGARFFYSNQDLTYACIFEILNPDTFGYIYEGEGEPTFEIIPYRGNHRLNYPTEQSVAQGVTYGMQNEYEGRLTLPPESTVLKDVEYGDDKVGTLEVIALSGATATADNIAVVNLTEQEVNRVKNCATVSTMQKCFEDFKEE